MSAGKHTLFTAPRYGVNLFERPRLLVPRGSLRITEFGSNCETTIEGDVPFERGCWHVAVGDEDQEGVDGREEDSTGES